jgi:hypothetical protein
MMKNFNSALLKSILMALTFTFFACGSDTGEETTEPVDTASAQQKIGNAQKIFYSIPSPIEMAGLIKKAGASYDKNILNDINNVSKYTATTSKALNLGVYGADLSYTSIYDGNAQESILYLKCSKNLADALGISGAFTEKTVERVQSNYGNKDSLMNIISDAYFITDEFLQEDQRGAVSSLVIAGGWIEALYLGTRLVKSTKDNAELTMRLAELKGSLDNLISMLESHKDVQAVTSVMPGLKSLKEVYDGIQVSSTAPTVKTDTTSKVTTIGGKSKYTFTPEQLDKVTALVGDLRANIIKF